MPGVQPGGQLLAASLPPCAAGVVGPQEEEEEGSLGPPVLVPCGPCHKAPQTGGASSRRNVFPRSPEGQKSKLRCGQGCAPSNTLSGRVRPASSSLWGYHPGPSLPPCSRDLSRACAGSPLRLPLLRTLGMAPGARSDHQDHLPSHSPSLKSIGKDPVSKGHISRFCRLGPDVFGATMQPTIHLGGMEPRGVTRAWGLLPMPPTLATPPLVLPHGVCPGPPRGRD